jgi:hypothetical protein
VRLISQHKRGYGDLFKPRVVSEEVARLVLAFDGHMFAGYLCPFNRAALVHFNIALA